MTHQVRARTPKLPIFLVATLLILSLSEANAIASGAPTAKIMNVIHPDNVLPDAKFQATLVANYSDKFLVDVGIWDNDRSEMIRSVTMISQFTGPGNATFPFELTAPNNINVWNLTAVTRVWWQNGWYQDPKGSMPFTVTLSKLVTLTLSTHGANSSLTFDDTRYDVVAANSVTLPVAPGVHSLEALQIIQTRQNERLVFAGWSDGVKSNPRQIVITQQTGVTAVYRPEFYLTVSSPIGRAVGSGWYEEGYRASFGVEPNYTAPMWFGFLTEYDHFSRWVGDSNSTQYSATVLMDAPKSVKAEFVETGWRLNFAAGAVALLFISILLATTGLLRHARGKRGRARRVTDALPMFILGLVIVSGLFTPTVCAAPLQPSVSIVKIGDASWYYWNQATSDTCVLWLGGGISQETHIGYNYYWINPFEYESFGTMQFIRDLSKYYCVIALEKGADPNTAPGSNRTINQELYEVQSIIIADVHAWIKNQGYQHTFLAGYSVGGQAAAMEVAVRDPEGWTASDGLILITVPLVKSVIDHASNMKANLLFLYGGNLPDFVATGQKFYDNAPAEGWTGDFYYHKEFHVLSDVGHEVWTVRDTGAYTLRAVNMVVGFVERCKALQFGTEADLPLSNSSALTLSSIHSPSKVATGTVFLIEGNLTYKSSSATSGGLVAYDEHDNQPLSVTVFELVREGEVTIPLVMPPIAAASQSSYILVPLLKMGDKWTRLEPQSRLEITASDSITLTIETPIPNATVVLDGSIHTLPANGIATFEVTRGTHSIQIMPLVTVGSNTRYVFSQWEDGSTLPQRQLTVDADVTFTALFRKQYLVTAATRYGVVLGAGWCDENSTASVLVQPSIIESERLVFAHWSGDSSDNSTRTLLQVDSPKAVEAEWDTFGNEGNMSSTSSLSWFFASLILFALLMFFNIKKRK